jgi:hypothetical protein
MTQERGNVMHISLATRKPSLVPASSHRPWWHSASLILFACLNVESTGVFFVVFVGVVISPPSPRSPLFLLVTGQFVYWSRIALRRVKERRA